MPPTCARCLAEFQTTQGLVDNPTPQVYTRPGGSIDFRRHTWRCRSREACDRRVRARTRTRAESAAFLSGRTIIGIESDDDTVLVRLQHDLVVEVDRVVPGPGESYVRWMVTAS
jgi:hypothetical protein